MNHLDRPANIGEPPPVEVALHAGLVLATDRHIDGKSFRLELVGDITGFLRGRLGEII